MINKLCLIGLIPYLYIYLKFNSYIALIIYINGSIFHSSYNTNYYKYFKYIDLTFNFVFLIYINYYTNYQPNTYIISAISIISYLVENYYTKTDLINDCIHIFLVQILLSYALFTPLKLSVEQLKDLKIK
jgi:hypothetical protein